MHSLLLCLSFLLGGAAERPGIPPDGTLIFLENCNSIVELTTRGQIGHAALVFHDAEACWVYEATPAKVRRVTLDEYYAELARLNKRRDDDDQIRVWLLRPLTAYTAAEALKMREYLDVQIGRRYSVRNYVRSNPSTGGIHCAELTSTTLNQSGRYAFENCHKINPQALYTSILPMHATPQELRLTPPGKEPWCQRAQRRTSEWFTWCGWSCREVWAWCW